MDANECDHPDTEPGTLIFEGDVYTKLSRSLIGIPGVVYPNKSSASILLTNISDHKVAIRQGTLTGMLTFMVEMADGRVKDYSETKFTYLTMRSRKYLIYLLRTKSTLSLGDSDIERIDTKPHKIELYGDTPIYQQPLRFPAPLAEEIYQQCRGL